MNYDSALSYNLGQQVFICSLKYSGQRKPWKKVLCSNGPPIEKNYPTNNVNNYVLPKKPNSAVHCCWQDFNFN